MINAVIVDDEPKAIQSLSWELTNFSDEITIIDTFSSPEDALEFLKSYSYLTELEYEAAKLRYGQQI